MTFARKYGKFLAEVLVTAVVALIAAMQDNTVDAAEWILVAIAAARAIAVLGAGNLPAGVWHYTKAIVAAASAVLVLWQSLASAGMTTSEWMQLAVAALGALGVYAVKGPVVESTGRHAAP